MSEHVLVVASDTSGAKPLLKLAVLDADMVYPGWMQFRLEASAPWEQPTVCWYRIPDEATHIELQHQLTDKDVQQWIRRTRWRRWRHRLASRWTRDVDE